MDNIWDRKSFEVGGHWTLSWGGKHRMATQNLHKSNAKNKSKTTTNKQRKQKNWNTNMELMSSSSNSISCLVLTKASAGFEVKWLSYLKSVTVI